MISAGCKFLNTLHLLKTDFNAKCIKAEFEAEGATYKEVEVLKNFTDDIGLDFVLKISGCEAVRDLKDACSLNITKIVAPMIESKYAFQKFVKSTSETVKNAELYINIETINGVDALDDILKSEEANILSGVIFGRSDFAGSLNLSDVECTEISEVVNTVSKKIFKNDKKFILGGGITPQSLDFIKKIPFITQIETRKVVFDREQISSNAIQKAVEFEIDWLEYKRSFSQCADDELRLQILRSRIENV